MTVAELSSNLFNLNCIGWPDSSWTVYLVISLWLDFYWVTSRWFDCNWTVYWVTWVWLNCVLSDLTLAELPTGWLVSWTVNWVNRFCLLIVLQLSVVELSQALADLFGGDWPPFEMSTGWLYSYWIVYWLSWMLLNSHRLCMLPEFTLSELSIEWVKSYWTAYWLSWMLLNCHKLYMICVQSDFFAIWIVYWVTIVFSTVLYTGYLECCWIFTGSNWIVCRVI